LSASYQAASLTFSVQPRKGCKASMQSISCRCQPAAQCHVPAVCLCALIKANTAPPRSQNLPRGHHWPCSQMCPAVAPRGTALTCHRRHLHQSAPDAACRCLLLHPSDCRSSLLSPTILASDWMLLSTLQSPLPGVRMATLPSSNTSVI